jgi:CHAD domain-containing protein
MLIPTFQLLLDEDPGDGLQRIVTEQVELALQHVGQETPAAEDVHEYRRVCKRVRSVLRLVRRVDPDLYRRENAAFRDAARRISPLRSTSVMTETVEDLVASGAIDAASVAVLAEYVAGAAAAVGAEILDHRQELVALMTDASRRFSGWSLPAKLAPTALGMQRTYSRGRQALAVAYATATNASFHRWRKRVKYMQHQAEVLSASSPAVGELALAAGTLSRGLGQHQDLADLSAVAGAAPFLFSSGAQHRRLLKAVTRRQDALRSELRPLGEELYVEAPEEFVARLTGYWVAWRDTA